MLVVELFNRSIPDFGGGIGRDNHLVVSHGKNYGLYVITQISVSSTRLGILKGNHLTSSYSLADRYLRNVC